MLELFGICGLRLLNFEECEVPEDLSNLPLDFTPDKMYLVEFEGSLMVTELAIRQDIS